MWKTPLTTYLSPTIPQQGRRGKGYEVAHMGSQWPGLNWPALGFPVLNEGTTCWQHRKWGRTHCRQCVKMISLLTLQHLQSLKLRDNFKIFSYFGFLQSSKLYRTLSLECGCLVTRVTSILFCHKGSEVTSRLHYLGPFIQSDPPKGHS